MSFELRLKKLMHIYNVTNKHLANELNVDPSLISRWKNGHRIPSEKYDQIRDIASFFIGLNQTIEQQTALKEIITEQKLLTPELNNNLDLLFAWLSENNSNYQDQENVSIQQLNSSPILKNKEVKKVIARPRFPLSNQTKKEFHLFVGNNGKRKAALLFLQRALDSTPTDIYIYTDELLEWWFEDNLFQIQWNSYLKLVVLKSHRIHIIHHVQRGQRPFTDYLSVWLPLHLVGNIQSYYLPKYVDPTIKETIMIIKDQIAFTSRSTMLTPTENIGLIFEDIETIQMQESLFIGRLVHSKQLIQVYKSHDFFLLLQILIDSTNREFDTVAVHANLNTVFLPDSVFERFAKTLPHKQQLIYLKQVKQWKALQFQQFSRIMYHDILPIELLHGFASKTKYHHYDPVLFLEDGIQLTNGEIVTSLKTMLYTYMRFTNVSFSLVKRETLSKKININIEQRALDNAFFTTNQELNATHIGLFCQESNTLYSFKTSIDEMLVETPSIYKDKNYIINLIEEVIKKLEH